MLGRARRHIGRYGLGRCCSSDVADGSGASRRLEVRPHRTTRQRQRYRQSQVRTRGELSHGQNPWRKKIKWNVRAAHSTADNDIASKTAQSFAHQRRRPRATIQTFHKPTAAPPTNTNGDRTRSSAIQPFTLAMKSRLDVMVMTRTTQPEKVSAQATAAIRTKRCALA